MRRRRSRSAEAFVAAACVLAAAEGTARAQACCIAPGAAGASRLGPHEAALAGIDARAQTAYGTLDHAGVYRGNPAGSRDVGLEQDVFGTVRVLERGQASVTLPFVQTLRTADALSSAGGGVGDVRVGLRWDLVFPDEAFPWPGIALLGGVSAPTGRAPEQAGDALGAGATGTGTTQGWAGFSLEQTKGPWLFAGSALVTVRADRDVGPVRSSLAPRFTTGLVGARAWRSGHALSLAAAWDVEDRAKADGVVVSGSARRALRLTSALQLHLGDAARLVVSVYGIPPVPAVTAGESATVGLSLAFIRPWS